MSAEQQTRLVRSFYLDPDGYDAIDKYPSEVVDYKLDFTDSLDAGDTLSSATFTVGTGLTKDSESSTATTATVWVSGGTDDGVYLVLCTAVTANGRTKKRQFRVYVKT